MKFINCNDKVLVCTKLFFNGKNKLETAFSEVKLKL